LGSKLKSFSLFFRLGLDTSYNQAEHIVISQQRLLILLLAFLVSIMGAMDNTTVIISPGDSNHGDPGLLCRPSSWIDIAIFFLGNYFAHAATIITLPGESTISVAIASLAALLFPITGMVRGVRAIRRFSILGKNDLEVAARAGALCTIVRSSSPDHGDGKRSDFQIMSSGSLIFEELSHSVTIHGRYPLEQDIFLRVVPQNSKFKNISRVSLWNRLLIQFKIKKAEPDAKSTTISCDYNFLKILIALAQTIFAATTLYRTRGDQINQYGYAAFGLTVTPYIFMSVINLMGNLVTPSYSTLYIVRSNDMESVTPEGTLDGIVGEITEPQEDPTHSNAAKWSSIEFLLITLTCVATPIAIVGGLSSFRPGSSTTPQRVWTMVWLAFGVCLSIVDAVANTAMDVRRDYLKARRRLWDSLVDKLETVSHHCDGTASHHLAGPNYVQYVTHKAERLLKVTNWHKEQSKSRIRPKIFADWEYQRALHDAIDDFTKPVPSRLINNDIGQWKQGNHWMKMQQDIEDALKNIQGQLEDITAQHSMLATQHRNLARLQYAQPNNTVLGWLVIVLYVICSIPAIGGFVVVGQMLRDYGVCIRIT
jgi:hypothetical protein